MIKSALHARNDMLAGPVGIASTSPAAAQEVIGLLGRDGIGVSQVFGLTPAQRDEDEVERLLAALHALQADPATGVMVVVAYALQPAGSARVLAELEGDKPAVACLLGTDARAVWRSGAVPAARLDEAAMRAAAWARGWDQALVSSRLLEQDDELAARAAALAASLPPERRALHAVFADPVFCYEAQLMLAGMAPGAVPDAESSTRPIPPDWEESLADAMADLRAAVVLIDVWVGHHGDPGRSVSVLRTLEWLAARAQGQPCLVGHVWGSTGPEAQAAEQRLGDAGVVLTPGNAAAARLAGMVLRELQ